MHNVSTTPQDLARPDALHWQGFEVLRGDASSIAKLTTYKRSYVDKVLRGVRKSAVVEQAALKFYTLRKELLA